MDERTFSTPQEILDQLRTYKRGHPFPLEAVEAAIARREEVTPLLLQELETAADDLSGIPEDYILHIYAVYLLSQFREQRALPVFIRFFSAPDDLIDEVTGDLTNTLDLFLASVSGSDFTPITQLIENENAGEFVRWEALNSLAVMVAYGAIPRDEVVAYFRSLFETKLTRASSSVWDGLLDATLRIHPGELISEIRRASEEGLFDPYVTSQADIDEVQAKSVEDVLAETRAERRLPVNAIEDLGSWPCFDEEASDDKGDEDLSPESALPPIRISLSLFSEPQLHGESVKASPKIGRNDLCPCGSGKKFKKCCGKEA